MAKVSLGVSRAVPSELLLTFLPLSLSPVKSAAEVCRCVTGTHSTENANVTRPRTIFSRRLALRPEGARTKRRPCAACVGQGGFSRGLSPEPERSAAPGRCKTLLFM
jgi:hypothetical protein